MRVYSNITSLEHSPAIVRAPFSTLIIHLGRAMLLALWWRVRHELLGIHLAPVHLCAGKGPTGTFNTGGVLDDFNPRARIHQPPHQAEVAATEL